MGAMPSSARPRAGIRVETHPVQPMQLDGDGGFTRSRQRPSRCDQHHDPNAVAPVPGNGQPLRTGWQA
jgi:hypothetical protein